MATIQTIFCKLDRLFKKEKREEGEAEKERDSTVTSNQH